MRASGLQNRIVFIALAPAVVLGIAFTSWYTQGDLKQQRQAFEQRTETVVQRLADGLVMPLSNNDNTLIQALLRRALDERDARSVRLFDRYGSETLHSGPSMIGPAYPYPIVATNRLSTFDSNDTRRYLVPVHQASDLQLHVTTLAPLGWLEIEFDYANTRVANYRAILINSIILFGGLLAVSGLAFWLSREISRPVHNMIDTVDAIREGNLDARVNENANGELGELESGINAMAGTLKEAYEEMQSDVDQATQDLRETLETIEIQNIELDMARREAQQANQVKTEFLANMSHEIRTPLNGIIGFARLLTKSNLTQKQDDYVSTILSSSQGLLTIINDVLDFCKIEAGKLMLDNRSTNLHETIEDVLVMLAPASQAKQLEVVSLFYADVPEQVVTDPLRLKQVLTNLVNNAIKFTPSGSIVVRTMVEQAQGDRLTVRISVTDTGIGLSRSEQKALFQAFAQADSSTAREFGGTGLGLVISKRLVEQMGGDIGLESSKGEGSTFWFSIKAQVAPESQQPPRQDALNGYTLAIVEEREMSRLALRHEAEKWGMNCFGVASLDDLVTQLEQADSQRPDLVLIDVSGQQIGDQLYRKILHLEQHWQCPTLVLGSSQDRDIHHQLIEQGAKHYVSKPIRDIQLYQAMLQVLRPDHLAATATDTDQPQQHASARVLAVDDNAANLKLIVTLLNSLGVQVDGVASGEQALDALLETDYDLVFMDIQMPGIDGLEATRRIRQQEAPMRHIPIIALTAHALAEERQAMLNSGMDDYLTKPIDEDQLQRTLFKWTGLTELASEDGTTVLPDEDAPQQIDHAALLDAAIIDLPLGLERASGKLDLAKDMFAMLLGNLETDRQRLQQLHEQSDYKALLEEVHRLHGATHYCGVPRVQQIARHTEVLLKQGQYDGLDEAMTLLLNALLELQRWAEQTDWPTEFDAIDLTQTSKRRTG